MKVPSGGASYGAHTSHGVHSQGADSHVSTSFSIGHDGHVSLSFAVGGEGDGRASDKTMASPEEASLLSSFFSSSTKHGDHPEASQDSLLDRLGQMFASLFAAAVTADTQRDLHVDEIGTTEHDGGPSLAMHDPHSPIIVMKTPPSPRVQSGFDTAPKVSAEVVSDRLARSRAGSPTSVVPLNGTALW